MRLRLLLSLLTLLPVLPAASQEPFDWFSRGPYQTAVPRPEALLGFPLGSRHTMFHQQRAVLDQLIAAAPERVRTEVIGRTVEGKEMRLLIISAPENIQRLDQIRADLDRLADPRTTSAPDAAQIAAGSPAVAMLSHSIHGAEPAGFEAVMQTAYQLLASSEPATMEILRNVVVILNPTMNPDGHERLAAWNNSVAVGTDDPAALEHSPPWSISARFNHYRFDMNRDVLAHSQEETRALTSAVLRWNPQVFVDLHSTTPQYYFPPWAQPINQNVPAASRASVERYGRANAGAFDRHGWQYYVRDQFDLHYPGYWDSWPSLNGAIGMTFETDGGPGIRIRKSDGTVTHFSDAIARHYVASMATLGVLASTREQALREYYEFRASGMAEVRARLFKRVVVAPSGDPARLEKFLDLMTRQRIEVTRTGAAFTSTAAHDYLAPGPAARRTFPAGSYVIDLAQPQARLATAILEPDPVVDSAFARRQLDMFERNRRRGEGSSREGYEFYDITAWALPFTLGLEAWWTEDTPPVSGEPATVPARPAGGVSGRAQSAYAWTGGTQQAARLAMQLMRDGVNVGAATEAMRADGRTWPRGTFVVRVARNDDRVHEAVAAQARDLGIMVTAIGSVFPETGQFGMGGSSVIPLRAPRILLAAGDGVSQTSFGDAWFYLERELQVPVVPIELAALSRVNLADYNILVIPDGNPGAMWGQMQSAADRVKAWVREGAAIIAWGSGAQLLARSELELATIRSVTQPEQGNGNARPPAPADTTLSPSARPAAPIVSPSAADRPESVPGLIARATLDPTHWITIGYDRPHLAVPINGSWFMAPGRRGDNVAVLGPSDNVLSGFTWPGNTERFLANASWAVVEPQGRGTVVAFAQNPLFRAFWRGPAGMLNNAILFGPRR